MATYIGNFATQIDMRAVLCEIKNNTGNIVHHISGEHFSEDYTALFGNLVNAVPIRAWVDQINPGKYSIYRGQQDPVARCDKKIIMYQLMLQDHLPGHFFLFDNSVVTDYKLGDVYRHRDYDNSPTCGNIGFQINYVYNFLGVVA